MGTVNELAKPSVVGHSHDLGVLTPPKFSVDQRVGFLGGCGTVKVCQYGRGSWIYAIAPLPVEPAEPAADPQPDSAIAPDAQAVLLLQEKDLWAIRDGVAPAVVAVLETDPDLDLNEEPEPSLAAELARHYEHALEPQSVG